MNTKLGRTLEEKISIVLNVYSGFEPWVSAVKNAFVVKNDQPNQRVVYGRKASHNEAEENVSQSTI